MKWITKRLDSLLRELACCVEHAQQEPDKWRIYCKLTDRYVAVIEYLNQRNTRAKQQQKQNAKQLETPS